MTSSRIASLSPSKRTALVAVLGAFGFVVWSGCGPGDETRYYCDGTGCFDCDAYGCTSVAPPTHKACSGSTSCSAGEVCTANGCRAICNGDANCPKGEVCKSGTCSAPTTDPGPKKECTTKGDCTNDNACINGVCQACGGANGPCPCAAASDCGTGQACVAGSCTSTQNACKFSSECDDGKVCADGQCLTSCEAAACGAGFTCEKGVCKPTTPGGQCTTDANCPPDASQCVGGACVKSCTGDAECGAGKYCNQGACAIDTRPHPNCTDDASCGGTSATPKKCLDGYCKYTCATDQYCRSIDGRIGFCAKDGVCRTETEAKAECLKSADCSDGKSCVDNKCQ